MFNKILRFGAAAGILDGGLYVTDQLYFNLVHKNLPARFQNWIAESAMKLRVYQYGTSAAGAIILVPLLARVIGLSEKSPIKPEKSPV